ncbi:MAG: response regulator [Dehalococcoidales bacterium]|nr:response regulator [Dehalococcoidales bacterium]
MTGKTKILAITSDPRLLNFLQDELAGGEFDLISTETTVSHVLGMINREQPDLIVMDIMMPSLDGIGLCLQLRRLIKTPVIMLTTWQTAPGMVRGLNLCADSYLTEPFDGEELKNRINKALERNHFAELLANATSA